ncbi:MAG: SpoIIE family protein phosphatase [Acutalibacteraceae bacterium]|nr:SpoIIE family protein phosphatase [Acutalibacteraceae bacterium]
MKEPVVAKTKKGLTETFSSKTTRIIISQVAYAVAGFMLSGGAVFGAYAPFGASLVASAPFNRLVAVLIGSVAGYFVITPGSSFRYIATVLAIGAIRWTLSDLKKITKNVLYPVLLAGLPMLTTGFVLAVVGNYQINLIIMAVIEALLSAVGAYFYFKSINILYSTRGIGTLNQQEIACLVMSGCLLLLALSAIGFGGVSLGRICAVLIILICARYGAVSGGCISGVSTGVIFSIADNSLSYIAGGYSFGGIMAGLFSYVGKTATTLVFLVCNVMMSFQSQDMSRIIATLYESVIAGVIFMLLPKDLGNTVSQIFTPSVDKTRSEGLRKNVIMRLEYASKALESVSVSVDNVADKMKELYSYNIENVFAKSVERVCNGCGLRSYCWEKDKETGYSDLIKLTPIIQKNGSITPEDFAKCYSKKCCKAPELVAVINKNYDSYTSYLSAERRVGEIRSVVAGQFSGLSEILSEMAEEFENYRQFDTASSERVSTLLKMQGFTPLEVSCRTDKMNRMTVEVEVQDTDKSLIKKAQLVKEVSKACGRYMDTPCISVVPNRCRIQMSERPLYDVQIGTAQHISGRGRLCGDCLNYFTDGLGRIVALISDGMGTGGRAAVDGSMAEGIMTKLIKAGLGFDCALQVVNSALMVKSGDESLATLDIICIDLFTGIAELMKAGAPATFVKKGDVVERVDFPSLPVGILTDVKLIHKTLHLADTDWVLMVSDGAIATGDRQIMDIMKHWKGGSAQEMAQVIVTEAKNIRNDGYDDDITAIALNMMSNVKESYEVEEH